MRAVLTTVQGANNYLFALQIWFLGEQDRILWTDIMTKSTEDEDSWGQLHMVEVHSASLQFRQHIIVCVISASMSLQSTMDKLPS